jgi:hypothetical protein
LTSQDIGFKFRNIGKSQSLLLLIGNFYIIEPEQIQANQDRGATGSDAIEIGYSGATTPNQLLQNNKPNIDNLGDGKY